MKRLLILMLFILPLLIVACGGGSSSDPISTPASTSWDDMTWDQGEWG